MNVKKVIQIILIALATGSLFLAQNVQARQFGAPIGARGNQAYGHGGHNYRSQGRNYNQPYAYGGRHTGYRNNYYAPYAPKRYYSPPRRYGYQPHGYGYRNFGYGYYR